MGNCIVRTGGVSGGPSECRHERLNEHNEKYFRHVEERNSVGPKKSWWKLPILSKLPLENEISNEASASPTSTDPFTVSASEDDTTKPSSATNNIESNETVISPPRKDSKQPRKRLKVDAQVDGWQVKRKGSALSLRLAKNRFIQLAAGSPDVVSPITLESHGKKSSTPRSFNPLEASMFSNEDLHTDFDRLLGGGMIWCEVLRTNNVASVAMSRPAVIGNDDTMKHPLFLAIGGEDGVLTVTEILDENSTRNLAVGQLLEDNSSVASAGRKFGETLEFQIEGTIRSIDFAPDGRHMVIGGDGCVAIMLKIILDPTTGSLFNLQALKKVERVDRVYAVQFSPDNSTLAIGGFDGEVALVEMDHLLSFENNSISPFEVSRSGLILCLDWSPDGKYLAIGGSDKVCAILDAANSLIHETTRSTAIQTLRWNHDGTYLAIGDREVTILAAGTFEVKCEISYTPSSPGPNAMRYRISSLCWSPDGSFLAVGGSDGACLVVESTTYALVHEIHRSGNISSLAWGQLQLPSGDCRRYLAVSDEGRSTAILKAGSENDGSVAESDDMSSNASTYFSAASDWVLREDCFRDIEPDIPEAIKPQGRITSVAFSRSNKSKSSSYLAYSCDDCSLTIMTCRDWKAVFQMEFAKPIRSMMFSCSNNLLALAGDEGVLYILSVPSRSIVFNTILSFPIQSIAFSKHDERLGVGSDDGVLSLLCPDENWEAAGEIETSDSPIITQDWCSKCMAVGRLDGIVAIYDTEKVLSNFFVPIAEYSHSLQTVNSQKISVSFGASGRFLVVAGESGVVSILSAKGGWVLCHQLKLDSSILSTKWSPGGRYLAFAGLNQTFRVMDTISWVEVMEVRDAMESVLDSQSVEGMSSVDWSVDGKWVAVGSAGGGIHVLGTTAWHLLAPSLNHLSLTAQKEEARHSFNVAAKLPEEDILGGLIVAT